MNKKEKVVYVYRTEEGIPFADLKKDKVEALETSMIHLESGEFFPTHIIINDKEKITELDINELFQMKQTIKTLRTQGIAEEDMIYENEENKDEYNLQ